MKAPEVIANLEKHLECINRQHTEKCKRDCYNCDACVTKSVTAESIETALKVLKFVEEKRKAHEQGHSEGQ